MKEHHASDFGRYAVQFKSFLEELSSAKPVPGGGSVAALVGALASALGGMVVHLTSGNEKYRHHSERMEELKHTFERVTEELSDLIRMDAEAFSFLMDAIRLPKGIEEAQRREKIREGYRRASFVPMQIAEKAFSLFEPMEELAEKGNLSAWTDTAIAVILLRSAVRAALLNVTINLPYLQEEETAARLREKMQELEEMSSQREARLLALCASRQDG